jgi:hypothetical protein
VRRLLPALLALGFAASGCADGGSESSGATATSADTTSTSATATTATTEAVPVDTTFVAEDVEALCAALEGLGDIDPAELPSQADVDRLRAVADGAPPGVAQPLAAIADFSQLALDRAGGTTPELERARADALEAAVVLIAYGNEACDIDVPLFDAIAGV